MRRTLLLLLCMVSLHTTLAQGSGQSDSLLVATDTVVVTVLGQTDMRQSSLNGRALLSGVQPELINALDHLPGVFKIHEAGYPLVYRGMTGNRLRIERNGALRTGFVSQGYLLEDVNPGNVEELSIVKGAKSVLYGSGGSGGVIKVNEISARNHHPNLAYLSYAHNGQSKTLGLRLSKKSQSFGWLLSGRIKDAANFNFSENQTAVNSARDQTSLKLSFYKESQSGNHHWTWNHDYSNGTIERPQGFQNNPFELRKYRNRYSYQTNLNLKSELGESRLEHNLWALFTENDQQYRSFNGDFTQLNVFENRNYTKQALGYRLNWRLPSNGKWQWELGADHISSVLDQRNVRDNFLNQVFDITTFTEKRQERMTGLFGLATLEKPDFSLDLSLRNDFAAIGSNDLAVNYYVITGGASLNWKAREHFKHTLSLNRQFRYPSQDESVGVVFGGRGTFRGNPDIKPEYSNQLEWSLLAKASHQWEIALNTWLAFFEDRISEVFLGNNEYTYRNQERARTYGGEARVDYRIPGLSAENQAYISLSGSFTIGDELTEEGWFSEGAPLLGIPPARLRLSAKWDKQVSNSFTLRSAFDIDHVFAYDRLPSGSIRQTFGTQETKAYILAGFNISGKLQLKKQSLEPGIRVTNLTDQAYFPFGARVMGMGRNVTGYLRFSF